MALSNTGFMDCCGLEIIYGFSYRSLTPDQQQKLLASQDVDLEQQIKEYIANKEQRYVKTDQDRARLYVKHIEGYRQQIADYVPVLLKSGAERASSKAHRKHLQENLDYYTDHVARNYNPNYSGYHKQWRDEFLANRLNRKDIMVQIEAAKKRASNNGRGGAIVVLNNSQRGVLHDIMLECGGITMFDGIWNPNHSSTLTGYMFPLHMDKNKPDSFIGQQKARKE